MLPSKYCLKPFVSFLAASLFTVSGAGSALADWRKDLGTFRVGIIETTAKKLSPAQLGAIRDAYSAALSMPVELIQMRDFPALIDAHASARVEYAMYSAAAFATASISCDCVEPLVAPVNTDGSTGTRTNLYLDKSVALSAITTSKGIAVGGADSLTGLGVPLSEFSTAGIALKGDETWLKIAPDLEAALGQLKDGSADGLFMSVPVVGLVAGDAPSAADSIKALAQTGRSLVPVWRSQPIPFGPQAIRRNLNPETKELLKTFLVGLAASDAELFDLIATGDAEKFEPVNASAYATSIKAVKALAEFSKLPKP